jgi:DNA modification methylase/transcription elongation factor Elf1
MSDQKKFIQESVFPVYDVKETQEEKAKKEHFQQRLAEKLKDPAFRQIEGFPLGTDEAILALSDPPYYTACPNPFLDEILAEWQQERREIRKELGLPDDENLPENVRVYQREPFAADVSEGKNDPIYNAHSYHTKVPHKAIMRYILHYTEPGDIVFDGFCGTGMTGVAAQLCGDKKVIESLGYRVDKKGIVYDGEKAVSRLGVRKAVLNDLSPAATFITYNYNTMVDTRALEKEAKRILKEVEEECGWMYETWHPHCDDPNRVKAKINYTVWSDVFRCPHCGEEMVFWDVAIDRTKAVINETWNCPGCNNLLAKVSRKNNVALRVEKVLDTLFDRETKLTIKQIRQTPVLINYSLGKKRYEKQPDKKDHELIMTIETSDNKGSFSTYRMPEGSESRRNDIIGLTYSHHFFSRRNFLVLSILKYKLKINNLPKKMINSMNWAATAITEGSSKLNRERLSGLPSKLAGTLYVGSTIREVNALAFLERKNKKLLDIRVSKTKDNNQLISTQSGSSFQKELKQADYIFVDPPFGSNLMYSELNFLWETLLNVFTNNSPEAIINKEQKKKLREYYLLLEDCFRSFYQLLKSGHWMTVEFHNSQNAVWNSILEALLQVGFVVADVRTLDKQQATFKQIVSSGAVKQDLVISAYKPTSEFENKFVIEGGTVSGAWSFINQHLEKLSMPSLQGQNIEVQGERMPYLLYDRMVAFHLVRGLTVPLSAAEFYQGLSQKYLMRDGMVFTPLQATQYDQLRMQADRVQQLALFVTDEVSTIQWLHAELNPEMGNGPQTYAELQPRFLKQLHQERHEKLPELQEILIQNFIQGKDGHWQVPDPENVAHLEQLRNRDLLREFNEYLTGKGRIKVFRSEAVRAGFSKAWGEHDYETIVQMAERLPEQALQEDPKLKLYYDNALNRAAKQPKQEPLI